MYNIPIDVVEQLHGKDRKKGKRAQDEKSRENDGLEFMRNIIRQDKSSNFFQ